MLQLDGFGRLGSRLVANSNRLDRTLTLTLTLTLLGTTPQPPFSLIRSFVTKEEVFIEWEVEEKRQHQGSSDDGEDGGVGDGFEIGFRAM